MDQTKALTAEQIEAIQKYAAAHGRSWKRELNGEWMRGCASPVLHALRNSHGPRWLTKFKLPK